MLAGHKLGAKNAQSAEVGLTGDPWDGDICNERPDKRNPLIRLPVFDNQLLTRSLHIRLSPLRDHG